MGFVTGAGWSRERRSPYNLRPQAEQQTVWTIRLIDRGNVRIVQLVSQFLTVDKFDL